MFSTLMAPSLGFLSRFSSVSLMLALMLRSQKKYWAATLPLVIEVVYLQSNGKQVVQTSPKGCVLWYAYPKNCAVP